MHIDVPLLGPPFCVLLRQSDLQRRAADLSVNVQEAGQEFSKESAFLGVEGCEDPLLNAVDVLARRLQQTVTSFGNEKLLHPLVGLRRHATDEPSALQSLEHRTDGRAIDRNLIDNGALIHAAPVTNGDQGSIFNGRDVVYLEFSADNFDRGL